MCVLMGTCLCVWGGGGECARVRKYVTTYMELNCAIQVDTDIVRSAAKSKNQIQKYNNNNKNRAYKESTKERAAQRVTRSF